MKVKDFIKRIEDIGYNDKTEIVFDLKNQDGKTYTDYYCQSIFGHMFGLNAISVEISKDYI